MKSKIAEDYKLDIEKLLHYGFILKDEKYVYEKDAQDDLHFEITLDPRKEELITEVKDEEGETYSLFNIEGINAYASALQEKAVELINDIKEKCFINLNIKLIIDKYVKEKYAIAPDNPFSDESGIEVYRNNKGKWFMVYMKVKYKCIGIDSEEETEIINLKELPEEINELIDNNFFFRAYHMNKKMWISVHLKKNAPIEKIFSLIDKSFTLVTK